VRKDILAYIRCPICHSTDFDVATLERDEREIREGQLICLGCDHRHPIHKGIVNLLPNPNSVIQSEQQGWVELLGETHEGLVETMLQLPYLEDDIWVTTYENFDQAMSKVNLAGKRVLDIGAGRCWSTRRIAIMGASYAMAIDILVERFIGLETANIYLEHDGLFFERVLGDMNNLPVQPGTFDIVFMTSTLHHSSDLVDTMRQVAASLASGGMAIVINEPVRSLFQSKELTGCAEIEHGINEHVYTVFEYLWAVRRAGLKSKLFFPRSVSRGLDRNEARIVQEMGLLGHRIVSRLWRRRLGRYAMCGSLLPAVYLVSSMPLVMIASK
jgi:SAM-dependent methyltransferase